MCKIGRHKDMKCQGNRWEHRPAGKPNCKETDGTKKGGIPKLRGCCCTDEDAVPTLRKPKFQYSRSNSIVPREIPPISAAEPYSELKCPAMAISTIPTKGTVILAKILGIASLKTSLLSFMAAKL